MMMHNVQSARLIARCCTVYLRFRTN